MLCILRIMLSQGACLSHAVIMSKRLNVSANFSLGYSHTIVSPYQKLWQYSDGDPLTWSSNAGEAWNNRAFWPNISLISEMIQDTVISTMECNSDSQSALQAINHTTKNPIILDILLKALNSVASHPYTSHILEKTKLSQIDSRSHSPSSLISS